MGLLLACLAHSAAGASRAVPQSCTAAPLRHPLLLLIPTHIPPATLPALLSGQLLPVQQPSQPFSHILWNTAAALPQVDLYCECPLWPDDGMCSLRDCSVCECEEQEVPEPWRKAEAVEACDSEWGWWRGGRAGGGCTQEAGAGGRVEGRGGLRAWI